METDISEPEHPEFSSELKTVVSLIWQTRQQLWSNNVVRETVTRLAGLGKKCEEWGMPRSAVTIYQYLVDELGVNAASAIDRLGVEPRETITNELYDTLGPTKQIEENFGKERLSAEGWETVRRTCAILHEKCNWEPTYSGTLVRIDRIDRLCDLVKTLEGERQPAAALAVARFGRSLQPRDANMVRDCERLREHYTPATTALRRSLYQHPDLEQAFRAFFIAPAVDLGKEAFKVSPEREFLEALSKECYRFVPTANSTDSWFGTVKLCAKGEAWPQSDSGEPMTLQCS